MTPPLPGARLRSINQWLKDNLQSATSLAKAPRSSAESLDEQMIEAFDTREDSLKDSMMKAGTWGTAEGLQSFPMQRLLLWQEVVAEFLPPSSSGVADD